MPADCSWHLRFRLRPKRLPKYQHTAPLHLKYLNRQPCCLQSKARLPSKRAFNFSDNTKT